MQTEREGDDMPSDPKNNARFQLTDARVTRVKEHPKCCFISLLCHAGKFPNYYDAVCFDQSVGKWAEGDAVTVTGELQQRKPKEQGGKWELQLVIRSMKPGSDQHAPRPKRSGEPKKPQHYTQDADDEIGF